MPEKLADFDYSPPMQWASPIESAVSGDSGELLNENIARIENLKLKVLHFPMLGQGEKDLFFRDLDILRGAFINIASRQETEKNEQTPDVTPKIRKEFEGLKVEGIIGNHPQIREILAILYHVAPSDLTVLLEGETGTGKELFARIVHLNSERTKFIAVNCGAFPPGVIESELFGHQRGAFTGASADRKGKFEEADGGTIFLDEIGELEPLAQVKLLRALEQGEIQRVGSDKLIHVNVRVIAATNRNLEKMVEKGEFREDLLYRINVCPLVLPPLRQRRDEIEILLEYFLREACGKMKKNLPLLDEGLKDFLFKVYDFPGNIRELKNIAQFIACMGQNRMVRLSDLPSRFRRGVVSLSSDTNIIVKDQSHRDAVMRDAEKAYWTRLLRKHKGNIRKLCADTELSKSRIYQILDGLSLKPAAFR